MTTFEIIIILLLVIIAVAVIYNMLILKQTISYNQTIIDANLRKMDAGLDERLENITIQLSNIDQDFKKLADIVDKMHRNLCVEIADKMVDRVYPPTCVTPCYAPNGICTNPQMDCINCPKRGTGGTWTTGTNISKEE